MWIVKYLGQLLLSHVPGGEHMNYYMQVARGSHRSGKAAERLVRLGSIYARLSQVRAIEGSEILEVGTGWDAINSILLSFFGAKKIYTFDIARHVRFALVKNVLMQARKIVNELADATNIPKKTLENRINRLADAEDLDTVFNCAGIHYRAPADATNTGMPGSSVDLVISYAVLAHLSEPLLKKLTSETRRVLRPDGVAFHTIGMQDPYCNLSPRIGRLRFLKYPGWFWWLINLNQFNYNNRFREKHYVDLFQQYGAKSVSTRSAPDPIALEELKSLHLAAEFRDLPPEQLATCSSEVTVRFQEHLP